MKILVQRVKQASVSVSLKNVGSIAHGLLLFLGIHKEDSPEKISGLIQKVISMRIFNDENHKMNKSIQEVQGSILVVSQFTLYGSLENGRRPEFTDAALPEPAFALYEQFVGEMSKALGQTVQTGIFGATMEVSLVNDGPVTFLLEK